MRRRDFLASSLAATALYGSNRIDFSRLSAITDEIADSPQGAIAFAHQYGLKNVELRDVPGPRPRKHYYALEQTELRQASRQFREAGLAVSFFNTPFFKYSLPGAEPSGGRPETNEDRERRLALFQNRVADLEKAFRAAEILRVDKIRVFTFRRVENPEPLFPRIAELLSEVARPAARAGIKLLVENEGSCNVATSGELALFMKLLTDRNTGLNWDSLNGIRTEVPFPDGYALLPKKRLWNVQMKGKGLLDYPERQDWAAIFRALEKDGYRGMVGLETHIFDGKMIEHSHACMKVLQEITRVS